MKPLPFNFLLAAGFVSVSHVFGAEPAPHLVHASQRRNRPATNGVKRVRL